jgi:hypothetical protein
MIFECERAFSPSINCLLWLQGVPGAYSEVAAEIAYPNCEAVPCEQFEGAFKVITKTL